MNYYSTEIWNGSAEEFIDHYGRKGALCDTAFPAYPLYSGQLELTPLAGTAWLSADAYVVGIHAALKASKE